MTNAASVFIAPVGLCTGINASTFTYMSEAVTAATVAAVHQYMNESTGDVGADGILASYDGLANAFNTVSNMVSLSTGQTLSSVTLTGGAAATTVTASAEQAKLNQIANILSACINNASSSATGCTNLFTYAVAPPVSPATLAFPTAAPPYAMAADGNGNVYFSTFNPVGVWMIPGASTAGAPVTPIQISNVVGSASRILVDGNGSIWASSLLGFVSQITPTSDPASTNFLNGYTTVQYTTPSPSYGLAANPGKAPGNNGVYVSSQATANQIDLLTGTGIAYAAAPGFPTASGAGGLNVPSAIAVDGALNTWAANDQPNAGTGLSLVTEISAAGVSLSPEGGFQKDATFFLNGRSIAVDQAGNVWVGSDGANFVTEIVGGAVPIYQPFALGLSNGRFQLKP